MEVASQLIASSEYRVVVGLGSTGLSCARHLHASGLPFVVVDTRTEPPGLDVLRSEMPDVEVFAGDCPQDLINGASELVVSPGVSLEESLVVQAQTAGVNVVGDIDLFVREATAPIIGITGSNAKSTVTELLGQMARDAGWNVGVGGNLGIPALELLGAERDLYVLELSSFQLERAGTLGLLAATVLNVSEDHLDRHGNMTAYHQAKHRIFRGCQCAVINPDDPLTVPLVSADVGLLSWRMAEPELEGFGLRVVESQEYLSRGFTPLLPVAAMGLHGRHNVANALAALALGASAGLPLNTMTETLKTFRGLPHRCEPVAQVAGVQYINDSKGTNVGATTAALAGLGGECNIVLIAGGQGKGADFAQLKQAVSKHCKAVVLIGEDAGLIERALSDSVRVKRASSMEQAVVMAADCAQVGDCVLLSPACASFDMFSGYEERGESFRSAVAELGGGVR